MYDIEHTFDRIERAWKSIGCKNAKQFSEFANEHGYYILEQTISKWRKGTTPSVENLLDICNVCGCDIDYLLGKNPCMTRQNTDIQKETGLSEEACKIITCNNVPDFFAEERKSDYRKYALAKQHIYLSWFIEHGLLSLLSDIDTEIDRTRVDKSGVQFIPDDLYDTLNDCFNKAIKHSTITERTYTYKDFIAYELINTGMKEVNRIQNQIAEQCGLEDFDDYGQFDEYFDDFVIYEADKRHLTEDERDEIGSLVIELYKLSFAHFQAKYEIQLNIQITVNQLHNLLNEYNKERTSNEPREKVENVNPRGTVEEQSKK